ncbi:MAG: hypothetical protein WBO17_03330 [Sphingorhabdus sp.]
MNDSRQCHSLTIQAKIHIRAATIERSVDSMSRGAEQERALEMTGFTQKFGKAFLAKVAVLTAAGMSVSGCTYDMGLGYASDGYGADYYECDPYGGFDSYYDCDNNLGFHNIGFGGGWYENYWYPGYGLFLFDNYGRRYPMRDNYRRYWGERRHHWYRENRSRPDGAGRRSRERRDYSNTDGVAPSGWRDRSSDRVRARGRDDSSQGEGRRERNPNWRTGGANGLSATPEVMRSVTPRRRGNGGVNAMPPVRTDGAMGRRPPGDEGRRLRQPVQATASPNMTAQDNTAPVAVPQPRGPRGDGPRPARSEGRPSRDTRPQ